MTAVSVPAIDAEWAVAIKALDGAAEICLACHVRPDADALGSMLAVAPALRARSGRARPRVIASFGDAPFEVPRILRFLPGLELLSPPEAYPGQPEVMVTFDAASPDRLGLLEPCAVRAGELIVLDHHASNTGFGSVRLVDPAAAATAVLADELISRLGVPLSAGIAMGLYAGLVSDTGSFRFAATSPLVHEMAARLLAIGIDPGAVAHELWDRAPFGYLGLVSAAAGGHGLVWTTVTRTDRAASELSLDAAESVIDVVRRTDEADVAVVLKESDDRQWQVSARSKGKVDVGSACVALGGGGHARAAGFIGAGSAAATVAALREQLARAPAAEARWRPAAGRYAGKNSRS